MSTVWTPRRWQSLFQRMLEDVRNAESGDEAFVALSRSGRRVLRQYSTSFFIVTRFLPADKLRQVEMIYAAVRYPDEIVDSFDWSDEQKLEGLREWHCEFRQALDIGDLTKSLEMGINPIVAAFAAVCLRHGIPADYYAAFLRAMERDVRPEPYANYDELINDYVFGSAVVVGYFLSYVYGTAPDYDLDEALSVARDLGTALQLTNFARDVAEDRQRGRSYLPKDWVYFDGIDETTRHMARRAKYLYSRVDARLKVFAVDSRTAIAACIRVYDQLNSRLLEEGRDLSVRESVPLRQKFKVLPMSKYWRIPSAYLLGR